MTTRGMRAATFGGAAIAALATLSWAGHSAAAAGTTPGTRVQSVAPATHSLDPLLQFQTFSGDISSSIDGVADNNPTGAPIQVHKNVAGATLRAAYLFAATIGGGNSLHTPTDGDITVNGTGVTWIPADTGTNDIGGSNAAADITAIIKSTIDAAGAGDTAITVSENAFTSVYDGEEIVAILDDPSVTNAGSVTIMYGANNPAGDTFNIGFAQPFNAATQQLQLSLGVSFGFQTSGAETGQYSILKANGNLVSSAVGGMDDCIEGKQGNYSTCTGGELLTVGGIGDSLNTPTDPTAHDVPCPGGTPGPRCDDELYGLNPFVASGASLAVGQRRQSIARRQHLHGCAVVRRSARCRGRRHITWARRREQPSGWPAHVHRACADRLGLACGGWNSGDVHLPDGSQRRPGRARDHHWRGSDVHLHVQERRDRRMGGELRRQLGRRTRHIHLEPGQEDLGGCHDRHPGPRSGRSRLGRRLACGGAGDRPRGSTAAPRGRRRVGGATAAPRSPVTLRSGRAGAASPRLAGEDGFEPSNAGSKVRCLTTWRLPSAASMVAPGRSASARRPGSRDAVMRHLGGDATALADAGLGEYRRPSPRMWQARQVSLALFGVPLALAATVPSWVFGRAAAGSR